MKLNQKITLTLSILIVFIIMTLGAFMLMVWVTSIQNQVAKDAMDLAIVIAETDEIQENLILENGYIAIQNHIEKLRLKTRAQYIYVVNMEGLYYSNPYPSRLGETISNENMNQVLTEGKRFTIMEMSFDATVEAYVPIYYEGEQVGAVVVGILNGRIVQEMKMSAFKLGLYMIMAIIIGIFFSYLLAQNIKKTIFGLEPTEIAFLLGQKEMVLENIKEGMVAVDEKGEVILINHSARQLLDIDEKDIGRNIKAFYFKEGFLAVLEDRTPRMGDEIRAGMDKTLHANFYPLYENEKFIGVMASFEDLSEVRRRAEELTDMKNLTQALRAQNHEFMNKLHGISGMIQLEEYDQAVAYIATISKARQEVLGLLSNQIKIPALAGLLLAKYNKASEAKIDVRLDENARVEQLPQTMSSDEICSIVGNLMENAIDELSGLHSPKMFFSIVENDEVLEIVVEDNGGGISEELSKRIFYRGVSSKGADRGYGLSVVKGIVTKYGGEIEFEVEEGTAFIVRIPYDVKN